MYHIWPRCYMLPSPAINTIYTTVQLLEVKMLVRTHAHTHTQCKDVRWCVHVYTTACVTQRLIITSERG